MTKAMRIVPVVIVLLFVVAVPLVSDSLSNLAGDGWLADFIAFANDSSNLLIVMTAISVGVLIIYAISCTAAARLYRRKEL